MRKITLSVLKYTLIDDYKGVETDYLRTPVEVFKNQIFYLIKNGYTPILIDDYYNNYHQLLDGNYFMITIDGNYEVNHQAVVFLSSLKIPTIIFSYISNKNNPVVNNSPLTDLNKLNEYKSRILGDIYLGDLPSDGINLVEELDLFRMVDSIPTESKYFSYLSDHNPTISLLVKNKDYNYGFTNIEGYIEGPIKDLLTIPRINCTSHLDINEFSSSLPKKVKKRSKWFRK